MPKRVVVFDVNETLLDVRHLAPNFERLFGETRVLKEWFSLLLLHSEVATLAGPYYDFPALAGATLEMIAASRGVALPNDEKQQILQGMRSLPPYADVVESLRTLRDAGFRLVTLTNSSQSAVNDQIKNAGLAEFFERNFSVDAIQRYKPAPEVYRMAASELKIEPSGLRMVAAHDWDVLGAMRAGCAGAFVARPGKVLFPLTPPPDIVAQDLIAVARQIVERDR